MLSPQGRFEIWQTVEALITVKAIPEVSRTYGETVCVAGIRTDMTTPRWLRLYPVTFRQSPRRQQFKKYDVVRLTARSHSTDQRPETLRPDRGRPLEVINHFSADRGWRTRRPLIEPLLRDSLCAVRRQQQFDRTSLAIVRPGQIEDFSWERGKPLSEAKRTFLDQGRLFLSEGESQSLPPLEDREWTFRYHFRCDGEPACRGHNCSVIDWEIGEAWRRWRRDYGEDDALTKIRDKWLGELCGSNRDTAFFVGNALRHQRSFMVLGVWWPPRKDQLELFA